jgi:hypothetical protein
MKGELRPRAPPVAAGCGRHPDRRHPRRWAADATSPAGRRGAGSGSPHTGIVIATASTRLN